jgi:hypothetical protein
MTHDKLLDRIAQAGLEPHGNVMPTNLVLALRAVVELHKPSNKYEKTYGVISCTCDPYFEYGHKYPCPTIQAIEKELR